mgnify:CR=1 FL=1
MQPIIVCRGSFKVLLTRVILSCFGNNFLHSTKLESLTSHWVYSYILIVKYPMQRLEIFKKFGIYLIKQTSWPFYLCWGLFSDWSCKWAADKKSIVFAWSFAESSLSKYQTLIPLLRNSNFKWVLSFYDDLTMPSSLFYVFTGSATGHVQRSKHRYKPPRTDRFVLDDGRRIPLPVYS